jgi:hypothetical protein
VGRRLRAAGAIACRVIPRGDGNPRTPNRRSNRDAGGCAAYQDANRYAISDPYTHGCAIGDADQDG